MWLRLLRDAENSLLDGMYISAYTTQKTRVRTIYSTHEFREILPGSTSYESHLMNVTQRFHGSIVSTNLLSTVAGLPQIPHVHLFARFTIHDGRGGQLGRYFAITLDWRFIKARWL